MTESSPNVIEIKLDRLIDNMRYRREIVTETGFSVTVGALQKRMARRVAHDGRRVWRHHDKARGGIVFVIEDIVGGQQQSYRLNNFVMLARELGGCWPHTKK